MNGNPPEHRAAETLFTSASWYDLSIDWAARLKREIPVLIDVFGPLGEGGILDAGCGTGHQARALAERGHRVVGADASEKMLELARGFADTTSTQVQLIHSTYATLYEKVGGGFDGLYCVGNSLAAAGTADEAMQAVRQFAACLRTGGRLFIQILNFPLMRSQTPCVRGPRITNVEGTEYVSVRHFVFRDDFVEVNNITLWKDVTWQFRAHAGRLYPITPEELHQWCHKYGIHVDGMWGSYAREAFDVTCSNDLILVGTRGS